MSRRKSRQSIGSVRYWHAGWSGRQPGDLLLPLARQQNRYAELMRISVPQTRLRSANPDLASGRIYDINKLYVTTKRDFAHAWSVCMPDPSLRLNLKLLFGIRDTAYYEVEILDAAGFPLTTAPEQDPDYPGGGSYQVEMARVLAVHRTQMGFSAAQAHLDRMATAHLTDF